MLEGMQSALRRQAAAMDGAVAQAAAQARTLSARECLQVLVRSHFEVLLGPDSDFIPVMLYNWRCLDEVHQRRLIATKDEYDAIWQNAVNGLHNAGFLGGDTKFARLMVLGAMNFMVTWYKPKKGDNLDTLSDKVVAFFLSQHA